MGYHYSHNFAPFKPMYFCRAFWMLATIWENHYIAYHYKGTPLYSNQPPVTTMSERTSSASTIRSNAVRCREVRLVPSKDKL